MKDFLSFAHRETKNLRRRAAELDAAGRESESLEILCLAEEIDTAADLVR